MSISRFIKRDKLVLYSTVPNLIMRQLLNLNLFQFTMNFQRMEILLAKVILTMEKKMGFGFIMMMIK